MGDVVATSARGSAQIRFVDNTKLVVGPNSQVTIDSFVFQGRSAKNFSLEAAQGTFRFITGVSAKNAYSIKTPSATIGGGALSSTSPSTVTEPMLVSGAVPFCSATGERRAAVPRSAGSAAW
jgi:hypothetical protein